MSGPEPVEDPELERLRELLLANDRREVEALRERVAELERRYLETGARSSEISEVLPAAIRQRRDERNDLSQALLPDVEHAMHESIRRDPTVMAEALYPVMGPTIRKLILSLFSFDQLRSGAKYRVSHAYLIHRETSLPLAVHTPDADDLEADMVSAMMEALRSFVQDAFHTTDVDGLQDLRVGDVTLWVEWGPRAVLAVVVHGYAPDRLRVGVQETLEQFHHDHRVELDDFVGDTEPFEPMTPVLAHLTESLSPAPGRGQKLRAALPVLALLVLVVAIVVLYLVLR